MDVLAVVILSAVEGLTEFLPISSTGHLMVTAAVLKLPPTEFLKSFEIFIQLGAIFAVTLLYAKRLVVEITLVKKLVVAFVPTAIIGFMSYSLVKDFLLGSLPIVAASLFAGGVILIFFELWLTQKSSQPEQNLSEISYRQAVIIGLWQTLAIIPGVSRAGATIVGGLYLGLSRRAIVEFSFLLAIPTMLAAVGFDLYQTGGAFNWNEYMILGFGFILSFAFALLTVKWLLSFVERHNFIWFGVYRLVVALLISLFLL